MPNFYLDSTLAEDLAKKQARKDEIAELQSALTAEETQLDEDIAEIEALQDYIAADFPPTETMSAPATFTATPSSTQVALAWSAVTGATSYRVERSENLTSFSPSTTVYTGSGTSYTNTGLTNGTTYYFRIFVLKSGANTSVPKYAVATPS